MLLAAHADRRLPGSGRAASVMADEICRRPFPPTESPLQIISGKIWEDNDACIRLSAKAKNDLT